MFYKTVLFLGQLFLALPVLLIALKWVDISIATIIFVLGIIFYIFGKKRI